jgi:hypothetical protein
MLPRDDLPAPAVQVPEDHANGEEPGWSSEQAQQSGSGGGGTSSQWEQQQAQAQDNSNTQSQGHRGAGEENRRPASTRYHNVQPPQQQRQHVPQYKLQAKITGLERTGKKDPILRFDVHVRMARSLATFSY